MKGSHMKDVILRATDLSKSFAADGVQTHVLGNIDMVLYEGDWTAIMGPSGSGKSTLLYCLSGMDKPTSGEVLFRDKAITEMRESQMADLRAQHFGFVFQQSQLVSNLTLYENIAVPGFLKAGRSDAQSRAVADRLIERMGLKDARNHLPSQSSGGEQQRCAIARSVVNEPDILFADEPTGSLNRSNTDEVLRMLGELNSEGQTICMVTHDARCASRADRVLYIEDGGIRGEMALAKHRGSDGEPASREREAQVLAWLASMEW